MCTGVELAHLPDNMADQVVRSGEDGFDFIIVPISSSGQKSMMRQELLLDSSAWQAYVVGRLSEAADLESPLEEISMDCRERLRRELSGISYLGLQAVSLTLTSANNTQLAVLVRDSVCQEMVRYQVWVEVPGERWDWWNTFRLMTESEERVKVCLHLSEKLLNWAELDRWLAEPVAAVSTGGTFYQARSSIYFGQDLPARLNVQTRQERTSSSQLGNREPSP